MPPEPTDDPVSNPREAAFWRRFLPRSVLGLAGLLFCMSIAAAFTGSVLYAYYRYELSKTESKVNSFQAKFDDKVKEATAAIAKERDASVQEVKRQLDELQKFSASGETLTSLLTKVAPSVFFVSTLDENGQPSVGSGFVVSSDSGQTFLLTSYTTIRAATRQPAPPITVTKTGQPDMKATLNGWDAENDLALLIVTKGSLPALKWAEGSPIAAVGDRVFVVSGLGAKGGAISQGFVADVSANGIQHDSPIGAAFQGGPLLNSKGEVLASASRTYSPLKFAPEAVFFGVPIRNACSSVLHCPSGGGAPAN
jgi:S1-C subfamily serine protease